MEAPDYAIAFGAGLPQFTAIGPKRFKIGNGAQYEMIDVLSIYWQDTYRPELIWRSFEAVDFDPRKDAVYILRRL